MRPNWHHSLLCARQMSGNGEPRTFWLSRAVTLRRRCTDRQVTRNSAADAAATLSRATVSGVALAGLLGAREVTKAAPRAIRGRWGSRPSSSETGPAARGGRAARLKIQALVEVASRAHCVTNAARCCGDAAIFV